MFALLFENKDFIVVCKPISISVHCDDQVVGFAALVSKQLQVKLYVVHRLDKVTSGLMIFAKSSAVAAQFGALFEAHAIAKYYLALSDKKPRKKQGTVKGDMQKSRRSSWKLLKSVNNPAISRFISVSAGAGRRLFLLKPETGKTHQLRVALKSIGSAIIGDPIYGAATTDKSTVDDILVADRCYLHAWQLAFNFANKEYNFRSDPDQGVLFLSPELTALLEPWSDPGSIKWSQA
ncbi:RNA pseudouridine synthase ['Osedax' symbiont bacterium Rs2_46_30_T18]|nr:RNA pseudouridine synthase ['Osedax' symbiont bacterium Rs2_46_30_T18]